MGYNITLLKVPEHLKNSVFDDSLLSDIAYDSDEKNEIAYTNFSNGNKEINLFEAVFNIIATNKGFFKVYTRDEYMKAKERLNDKRISEEMQNKINAFLIAMERELVKGEIVFFCCD